MNLKIILKILKIIKPKKTKVVFPQNKKNERICKKIKIYC